MRSSKWLAILLMAGLGIVVALACGARLIHREYSHQPAALAFREAFRQPVPPEVRELAAAGESSLGGSTVWLRFRATPETIRALTASAEKDEPWTKGSDPIRDDPPTLAHYRVLDRLGWSQAWSLRQADYYFQGSIENSTHIAVDRETGTVYVFHWNS